MSQKYCFIRLIKGFLKILCGEEDVATVVFISSRLGCISAVVVFSIVGIAFSGVENVISVGFSVEISNFSSSAMIISDGFSCSEIISLAKR